MSGRYENPKPVTQEAKAASITELTQADWKEMELQSIKQVREAKRLLAAGETLYRRAMQMVNAFGQETEQDLADRKAAELFKDHSEEKKDKAGEKNAINEMAK